VKPVLCQAPFCVLPALRYLCQDLFGGEGAKGAKGEWVHCNAPVANIKDHVREIDTNAASRQASRGAGPLLCN